jgi:hypothetical protein
LDRNTGVPDSYHIPSSLSRMREAIKACSTPLRRQVVNGCNGMVATSRLLAADTSLLLRPSLWLRLLALSGAQFRLTSRRVKREAGENARGV